MSKHCSLSMPILAVIAASLGITILIGCGGSDTVNVIPENKVGPPLLEDVTKTSGIVHSFRNGEDANHYAILESLGGGAGLIDFDNDGLYDVFVTGGGHYIGDDKKTITGHPCRFFRNKGGMKFEDVTKEVGLDSIDFFSHGVAVADFDRDGWPDLLVTGYGRLALFHNEPIDPKDPSKGRKFVDITEKAGLMKTTWTTSAAWADFDGDGYPDLYICQYVNWSFDNHPDCGGYTPKHKKDVCPPKRYVGLEHYLFRNNGNGTFTSVAKEAGLRVNGMKDSTGGQIDLGKGLGVVVACFDNSRRPSIFVANDTVPNFLYMNLGKWKFEESATTKGGAKDDRGNPNGNMGIDVGDYNRIGFPSVFVATYENEMFALFQNLGSKEGKWAGLLHSTTVAGIAAIGQRNVGFGSVFVDLDQDRHEDLMIVNGHVIRHPDQAGLAQKPVLLHNTGKNKFVPFTEQGGSYCTSEHRGRGMAMGDLDNDGRPDFVISNVNEPTAVLRGIVGEDGKRPHWIGFDLKGLKHRDIVGTRVVLHVGAEKLTRFLKGGGSYMSAHDPRVLVGLGDAVKVDRITIEWSHGKDQEIDMKDISVDHYYRILEGNPTPQAWGK